MKDERLTVKKMKEDVLAEFLIKHMITSLMGKLVIGAVVGILLAGVVMCVVGVLDVPVFLMYAVIGIALMGSIPFQTMLDSRRQVKTNPIYANPITYRFGEQGITAEQGKQKELIPWQNIGKVLGSKKAIGICYGRRNVLVIPREDFNNRAAGIRKIMEEKLAPGVVRI